MSEVTKLGVLLDETAERDAVHVAVAPVIAFEPLGPGDHVGLIGPKNYAGRQAAQLIGIVDPFLTTRVLKDERFWMFLYPQTITSLRHQWTHPSFDPEPARHTAKEVSEAWLRAFIATADCPSYEEVVSAALGNHDVHRQWDESEYLHFNGIDAHGDIPPEFWDHIEVVAGVKIPPQKRAKAFSCGC